VRKSSVVMVVILGYYLTDGVYCFILSSWEKGEMRKEKGERRKEMRDVGGSLYRKKGMWKGVYIENKCV
jgi:hypothetical protein